MLAYPKVGLEIAAASELAVADLEGHGHAVTNFKVLMKAFL